MSTRRAPRLDERRAADFAAELRARARVWLPSWDLADGEGDFGRALLDIAARFSAEVAERLDEAGDKMRRGFLDWLAVGREAARPARMPVVFKLTDGASAAVLAPAPVRMQADAAGVPVIFETSTDVRVVPGAVTTVVAVDADRDAYFIAPPGLSDLTALEPVPTEWQLQSFASVGAKRLQLDPAEGLKKDLIVEAGGHHYRLAQVDGNLVTIEPPLETELAERSRVAKVSTFAPFEASARNWQAHALYLGDADLLNIEAEATIFVVGATALSAGMTWEYWGTRDGDDLVDWQPLTPAPGAEQTVRGALALTKPKGTIEEREIAGRNSRWIRAFTPTLAVDAKPFTSDAIGLRINGGKDCNSYPECPPPTPVDSPAAEAMANTTPLVLDGVFFPLGKEPKQFDAFYLGSQEAFSKKGAKVQLCFELAEPTFAALSAVQTGSQADGVLAGVGKDGALHLLAFDPGSGNLTKFRQREPLQPPMPGFNSVQNPGATISLDVNEGWRLPTWSEVEVPASPEQGFLVATIGGNAVWVWHEHPDRQFSGWAPSFELPAVDDTPAVQGLVYLAGTPPLLALLLNERLFLRDWPSGTTWNEVPTLEDGDEDEPVALESIVPVLVENAEGQFVTSAASGMVGVSTDGRLFHVATDGFCTEIDPATNFSRVVRPVAVETGGDRIVIAVKQTSPPQLWAIRDSGTPEQVPFEDADTIVGPLDAVLIEGADPPHERIHVLAAVRDSGPGHLTTWAPFASGANATKLDSPVTTSGGRVGGAATAIANYVVIPGPTADVLVTDFDPARRRVRQATIGVGIVAPATLSMLAVDDLILREHDDEAEHRRITRAGLTKSGEIFYAIEDTFPEEATGLFAYDLSEVLQGSFDGTTDQWTLDTSDHATATNAWIWIVDQFYHVDSIVDPQAIPRVAVISSPTGTVNPPDGPYVPPLVVNGRVAPYMALDPGSNGDWDAALLDRLKIIFPDEDPSEQSAKAFDIGVGNRPVVVVLGAEFQQPVNQPADFIIDAATGEWQRKLGQTASNPELSWEYWNGKGWWGLDVTFDTTLHLKQTGAVRFTVPRDIAPSDWAGKTNQWIRARLIGGDYGREKVTVTTTDLGNNKTEQTIERSTEGIRAPSVVELHISYFVCEDVLPTFVLAQDSGSFRDQSDANRTPGAIVEAFVPLNLLLGRLEDAAPRSDATTDCPPACPCGTPDRPDRSMAPAESPGQRTTTRATGRALFIGVNASLSEAPVNVLMLVDERSYTDFAPMRIDTIVADRFVPIVADDSTRALGESGVLSMTFAVPPARRDMFGQVLALAWLRLRPAERATDTAAWRPTVRGVYLNAVWARATETLTRELLGSSEGAPWLSFTLQRPPVLRHTLELRVKEPLGEEERDALRGIDERRVLSAVDGLPGEWVLWDQVIDPSDCGPDARVYSLDEATGVIRFGDGLHGMIPPIGRDSIVAFSYQRTEPGPANAATVPANTIAARTALNLITPVESVEAVVAADHAAGGAPAETDDRVLRFGFARVRHRNRAVTLQDLEDLALQSSPDIVQARAARRGASVRLTIVMRGANPIPTAAQVRELRRVLLEQAAVALSAPKALRIEGPTLRPLRIDLELRVETLDVAGAVGRDVKARLARIFDTATGGIDGLGWGLGVQPSPDDVTFALLDTPHLESLLDVGLYEIAADGRERPWPSSLTQTDLVVLAEDPVRLHFATAEVTA